MLTQAMATQRSDGRWQAKGKILGREKYFYASSPEEAEELKQLAIEASRGPALSDRPTYAEFVYTVFWPNRAERLKPLSRVKYDGQLRNHILPVLGRRRLHDIGLKDLMELKASLSNQGNAKARRRHPIGSREAFQILALAKSSLEFARKAGLTHKEDWKLLGMPRFRAKKERKEFPERLVETLIAMAIEKGMEWMAGPLWCAGYLGLRRGEICGLYKKDLSGDVLTIRRQRQRIGGLGTVDRDLKSESSARELTIGTRLAKQLADHQSEHPIYMFSGAFGRPLKPDRITEAFAKLREWCELPEGLDFHDLRSHAGSNLLDLGVDLATIMLILGQSKIDTTMLYIEINRRQKTDAFKRLDRSLKGKGQ
jgi:integrase